MEKDTKAILIVERWKGMENFIGQMGKFLKAIIMIIRDMV